MNKTNTVLDIDSVSFINTSAPLLESGMKTVQHILDALQCMAMIIDENNRVVFCNRQTLNVFAIGNPQIKQNLLPGDVLGCNYSLNTTTGCGTTHNCRYCDLFNIIIDSRNNNNSIIRECRIMAQTDNPVLAYDLQVQAAPLQIDGHNYIILNMNDISHEKRRKNLERIFFHDIINIAGGLQGLVECFVDDQAPELLQSINQASHTILEEIYAQRDLASAENGDLRVVSSFITSIQMLTDVCNTMQHHTAASGKTIAIDVDADSFHFFSDTRLIKRVLINMIKNALEASEDGETVTLGCNDKTDTFEFWVNNPAVMSTDTQMHIFHRSFSTKGNDRGLGTYSMRLLTERYLNGTITFTSVPGLGTTFQLSLPKEAVKSLDLK